MIEKKNQEVNKKEVKLNKYNLVSVNGLHWYNIQWSSL